MIVKDRKLKFELQAILNYVSYVMDIMTIANYLVYVSGSFQGRHCSGWVLSLAALTIVTP